MKLTFTIEPSTAPIWTRPTWEESQNSIKPELTDKVKQYTAIVISNGKKWVSFPLDEFRKEYKRYSKKPEVYSLVHKADSILKVGVEEISTQYNKWTKELTQ